MASFEPGLMELIEIVVQRMLRHHYGPMPARVVRVGATQAGNTRADIQPLVNFPRSDRETKDRTYVQAQVISDVPVLLPASGASDQSLKLAQNDVGLYIPTMYSLDDLLDTNIQGPVDVTDTSLHGIRDGFFLPLIMNRTLPTGAARTADRVIFGGDVRIGDNPATAKSLAFQNSVQDAVDSLANAINSVATAAGMAPPPYNPLTIPQVGGTSDLKGN